MNIEILLIGYVCVIIIGIDIAMVAARMEMYNEIKGFKKYRIKELSNGTYSSICFYLLPSDNLIKITQYLPITYMFDKRIKKMLQNYTYNNENIIDRLRRIDELQKLPYDEIKDMKISIK